MRYAEYMKVPRIPMRLPVAAKERGLVLYMPMVSPHGNILQDFSGYGNHGTIHGATWTDGKFGKALSFDGVDDYVDCGNDDSFNSDSSTVELWFRPGPETYTMLMPRGNWSQPDTWKGFHLAYHFNRRVNFVVGDGYEHSHDISSDTIVPEGVWCHVALVMTPEGSRLYINGKFEKETTAPYAPYTAYPLRIAFPTNSRDYFDGLISEVRIYNRALSEEEIKAHYLGLQYLVRG